MALVLLTISDIASGKDACIMYPPFRLFPSAQFNVHTKSLTIKTGYIQMTHITLDSSACFIFPRQSVTSFRSVMCLDWGWVGVGGSSQKQGLMGNHGTNEQMGTMLGSSTERTREKKNMTNPIWPQLLYKVIRWCRSCMGTVLGGPPTQY